MVKTSKFLNIHFSQLHASFFTLIDGNLGVLKATLEKSEKKRTEFAKSSLSHPKESVRREIQFQTLRSLISGQTSGGLNT